jgi:ABC-2 type transport system ATP-binding protein
MRQLLAIAAAMLKAPELLILDEPTNGLDPAGMVEVRELIRTPGSDGRTTVFRSSHLLSEVASACDAMTILRRGGLVTSGPVREILAMAGSSAALMLRFDDEQQTRRAVAVLTASGGRPCPVPPGTVQVGSPAWAHVNAMLGAQGLWAAEITPVRPDLERAFLDLTATHDASA